MKNKTKRTVKILCAVLLIVLLQVMGYTYAKYIAQEGGTGRAEVAKWAFQIVKEGAQTKTINLADTVDKDSLVDGKIAPGTTGTMEITLDATGSEVDVDYELKFENEKNRPTNMRFRCEGKEYDTLTEIIPVIGKLKHDSQSKQRRVVLSWWWDYEKGKTEEEITANDLIDTEEANKITEYTFDIIATATQGE